jgi:hypothetical protein
MSRFIGLRWREATSSSRSRRRFLLRWKFAAISLLSILNGIGVWLLISHFGSKDPVNYVSLCVVSFTLAITEWTLFDPAIYSQVIDRIVDIIRNRQRS